MENIDQMRKRHEAEIAALEDSCPHKKLSNWLDWEWASGHFSGRVKVCESCGKVVKRDNKAGPIMQLLIDNPPLGPLTPKELDKLKKRKEIE